MPTTAKILMAKFMLVSGALVLLALRGVRRPWRELWRENKEVIALFAITSLVVTALQFGLNALFPSTEFMQFLAQKFLPAADGLANGAAVFAGFAWSFIVISFFDYWSHRRVLHHRFFWGLHEYHHLSPRLRERFEVERMCNLGGSSAPP